LARLNSDPPSPFHNLSFCESSSSWILVIVLLFSPHELYNIPPARDGHRRSFSEADKRRIVEEAMQPGASLSEVAIALSARPVVVFDDVNAKLSPRK
jgi:hypothetical protein